jgi:hypothetical protein
MIAGDGENAFKFHLSLLSVLIEWAKKKQPGALYQGNPAVRNRPVAFRP